MASGINRQILLVEKPTGKLAADHFKMSEAAIPEPKDGEVLLRVRYISLDAANRAWMHGAHLPFGRRSQHRHGGWRHCRSGVGQGPRFCCR